MVIFLKKLKIGDKFIDKGFKNLHVIDLDGALTGETVNLDIVKEIVSKFDFKVEVGGGVRDFDSIHVHFIFRKMKTLFQIVFFTGFENRLTGLKTFFMLRSKFV